MSGPLEGVRVIDVTTNVLGPVAGQILGDMGADVIKIETPEGDTMREMGPSRNPGMAAFFLNINRNKRSMVLNLKDPAAYEALLRLVDTADVFIHNMRLDAADRLKIGPEAIRGRNPKIVYAAASGFKKDGKWRDRPAYDDVIQGMTCIPSLYEQVTGQPSFIPMNFADKYSGVVLASAIGMALFRSSRTGLGEEVHVPMFETVLTFNLLEHLWVGSFGDKLGYPRVLSPRRHPYRTKDGYVCLLSTRDDQWRKLFAAFDHPEMADDERFSSLQNRTENISALLETLAGLLAEHTTSECQARLDRAGIPNGPVAALEGLTDDPYLRETGYFQKIDHPSEGQLVTTSIPVRFTDSPGTIRRPAPRLGEHTGEILAELGYSQAEVDALDSSTVQGAA
jgi:crotonobetainyl-CoA:carnitine CoA-transferase CaiB-like acyl-CoA transferase